MGKEKKEIGMLLELLNEYDKEKGLHTFWKTTQSNKIQIYGKGVCSESYLYSKSYGFIKWLVENDKIDLGLYREYMPNLGEDFSVENNIIMNLSIAIDPIGYLNYILK